MQTKEHVNLMGVVHRCRFLPQVLQALTELQERQGIDPKRGIALEITPEELKLLETFYPQTVEFVRAQKPRIAEFLNQHLQKAVHIQPKLESEITGCRGDLLGSYWEDVPFWYGIFQFAKQNNIRVIPMDSEAVLARTIVNFARSKFTSGKKEWEKVMETFNFLKLPIREKIFAKKGAQEMPSLVILGEAHRDAVQAQLKKRKIKTGIIHLPKSRYVQSVAKHSDQQNIQVRKQYAARKKAARRKRIWERIKKRIFKKPAQLR